jgi:hypothetical protein
MATEGSDGQRATHDYALRLFEEVSGIYATRLEAWRQFCMDIGLQPDEVDQAHFCYQNPLVELVLQAVPTEHRQIDAKLFEQELTAFRSFWKSRR